ncbi:MAG: signal peptidase II [Myxococcales bacterium]|nr:signal peptidase II [Myxococcales bacterium]
MPPAPVSVPDAQPGGAPPPAAAPPGSGAPIAGDRLLTPLGATRVAAPPGRHRPSYGFLAFVSAVTLAADVGTKAWAAQRLEGYPGAVEVWKNHLTLVLARNRGGAWGLLQSTSENVRRPFFLLVSVAAIAFIMMLYRKLQPRQRALYWGLPLVLGGALGNVLDRIRYGQVIDFIDAHIVIHGIDHHWPTFNVADIAICIGVGLMAVDMFTSRRHHGPVFSPRVPPAQSGEAAVDLDGVVVDPGPGDEGGPRSTPELDP